MVGDRSSANAIWETWHAVRRHRTKAAVMFVSVAAGVGLFTFLTPKEYRSEAKLFVRLGRENATLDSTATLGQSPIVAVPQSRDSEINSVVEILQSRVLLEKVVDALGPTAISGQEDRERALQQLAKHLTVEAAKKSDVIRVSYQGFSPAICQSVVARLVDSYLDEHARLNRPQRSREFFAEQTRRLRSQLSRREEELRDLKDATGLASPAAQRQQMVAEIGQLRDDLFRAEAAGAESKAKVRELRRQLASLPDTQVTNETSGFGNEGTDRMREQFYALQVLEKEAQAKYSDDHPKMRQIRQQVAAARAVLEREEKNRKQVTKEPNRLRQQALAALLIEEPILASLEARAGQVKAQLVAVRGELNKLNEDEMRLATAERDVDVLESDYRKYAANLKQARIDQQLETERMSNISVVQSAELRTASGLPSQAVQSDVGALRRSVRRLGVAVGALCASALRRGFPTIESGLWTCRSARPDPGIKLGN